MYINGNSAILHVYSGKVVTILLNSFNELVNTTYFTKTFGESANK